MTAILEKKDSSEKALAMLFSVVGGENASLDQVIEAMQGLQSLRALLDEFNVVLNQLVSANPRVVYKKLRGLIEATQFETAANLAAFLLPAFKASSPRSTLYRYQRAAKALDAEKKAWNADDINGAQWQLDIAERNVPNLKIVKHEREGVKAKLEVLANTELEEIVANRYDETGTSLHSVLSKIQRVRNTVADTVLGQELEVSVGKQIEARGLAIRAHDILRGESPDLDYAQTLVNDAKAANANDPEVRSAETKLNEKRANKNGGNGTQPENVDQAIDLAKQKFAEGEPMQGWMAIIAANTANEGNTELLGFVREVLEATASPALPEFDTLWGTQDWTGMMGFTVKMLDDTEFLDSVAAAYKPAATTTVEVERMTDLQFLNSVTLIQNLVKASDYPKATSDALELLQQLPREKNDAQLFYGAIITLANKLDGQDLVDAEPLIEAILLHQENHYGAIVQRDRIQEARATLGISNGHGGVPEIGETVEQDHGD